MISLDEHEASALGGAMTMDPRSYAERFLAALEEAKLDLRLQMATRRIVRLEGRRPALAGEVVLGLLAVSAVVQCVLVAMAAWDLAGLVGWVDPGCGWTCWRGDEPRRRLCWALNASLTCLVFVRLLVSVHPNARPSGAAGSAEGSEDVFKKLAILEEREALSKSASDSSSSKRVFNRL